MFITASNVGPTAAVGPSCDVLTLHGERRHAAHVTEDVLRSRDLRRLPAQIICCHITMDDLPGGRVISRFARKTANKGASKWTCAAHTPIPTDGRRLIMVTGSGFFGSG